MPWPRPSVACTSVLYDSKPVQQVPCWLDKRDLVTGRYQKRIRCPVFSYPIFTRQDRIDRLTDQGRVPVFLGACFYIVPDGTVSVRLSVVFGCAVGKLNCRRSVGWYEDLERNCARQTQPFRFYNVFTLDLSWMSSQAWRIWFEEVRFRNDIQKLSQVFRYQEMLSGSSIIPENHVGYKVTGFTHAHPKVPHTASIWCARLVKSEVRVGQLILPMLPREN